MIIKKMALGYLGANCYILIDEDTRKALIIAPGAEAKRVVQDVKLEGLDVEAIVLTHGHYDHIGGADEVRQALKTKILIHKKDAHMLEDPSENLSSKYEGGGISFTADQRLTHEDTISFGNTTAKVIHTPGHTQGGICLLIDNHLFAGDTLFLRSVGRSDLPGGNEAQLAKSIKERLYKLDPETTVYPGHGPETTIGFEKEKNFIVRA